MNKQNWEIDQVIRINDADHKILSIDKGQFTLQNRTTGQIVPMSKNELLDKYTKGELDSNILTLKNGLRVIKCRLIKGKSISELTPIDKERTLKTHMFLTQLVECNVPALNPKTRVEQVTLIAKSVGIRTPSERTWKRWLKRLVLSENDPQATMSKTEMRGGRGRPRSSDEVNSIIESKIDELLDGTTSAFTGLTLKTKVDESIKDFNEKHRDKKPLLSPSVRTLQRRLKNVGLSRKLTNQLGWKAAAEALKPFGRARKTMTILQEVQIDHHTMDVMIKNETGHAHRATLTLLLDKHSRCILGMSLSGEGNNSDEVLEAIRHAITPKTYLKAAFPDHDLEWPCYGIFEKLVCDNGSEFASEAITMATYTLGIFGEKAQSHTPNDKAHIERCFRTLNLDVHRLPGTTLSNSEQRKKTNPSSLPTLTFEDLNLFLHLAIQKYHRTSHRGLHGKTPIEVWEECAKTNPPRLKHDISELELACSRAATRPIHHYGVEINRHTYNSPQLQELKAELPEKTEVLVRSTGSDVGHVFVYHPSKNEYFEVANRDPEFIGITIRQSDLILNDYKKSNDQRSAIRQDKSVALETFVLEKDQKAKQVDIRKQHRAMGKNSRKANSISGRAHKAPPIRPPVSVTSQPSMTLLSEGI